MKFVIALVIIVITFVIVVASFAKTLPISLLNQNIDIVQLSYFAFNESDWSSFAELHSPSYVQHAPDFKDPIPWQSYDLSCRIARNRMPDLKYRILDIFAFKDKVACRVVWECSNDSYQFKHLFPGGVVKGSMISMSLIKGGKIIEEWVEYDTVGIQKLVTFYKSREHVK